MEWPVTYRRKMRFSDTDAQGIVFNGNYATYIDDAVTDYCESLGFKWSEFQDSGYDMVLGRSEIDFRSAARYGDVLVTGARIARIGKTSVVFELRSWVESEDRVVIDAKLVQVIVDHETFKPKPAPQFFVDAVEKLQGAPVER
jgi:acyl-CoA thioester hydrolase